MYKLNCTYNVILLYQQSTVFDIYINIYIYRHLNEVHNQTNQNMKAMQSPVQIKQ